MTIPEPGTKETLRKLLNFVLIAVLVMVFWLVSGIILFVICSLELG
jgi:heme/copper-type cytochrome/quinol oxidase subunit 2